MRIDLIAMPAERVWRVRYEGLMLSGHLVEEGDRWSVWQAADGGSTQAMKVRPLSREAAGLLLVFNHLERERKMLNQREASDERAEAEGDEVSE